MRARSVLRRVRRLGTALSLAATLAGVGACTRIEGRHERTPRPGTGTLRAGAAAVEIAPIPGIPMGGHSLESRTGLGTWTPLYARALYLEDAQGEPLVFVVVDLWAVSAGLADEVARRLRDEAGLAHVGRENLLLSATHTHHGPGNFASNRIYNQHASNLPGFDPVLFDYVAGRIVAAAAAAADAAVPAHVTKHTGRMRGVARNRSFEAFARTPEAATLVAGNADLPPCVEAAPGPPEACRAVDPTIRLLRVADRKRGDTLAIFAQAAFHPTAMPNHTEVYHGDVFAMAVDRLERALADGGGGPVVILANGPEGDVSPNWTVQGPAETRRLADRLARQLEEVLRAPSEGEVTGPFVPHHAVVRLAGRTVEAFGRTLATARRPLAGRSQAVGAEDGPTVFRRLGWTEGMALPAGESAMPGQGRKLPVLPVPLAELFLPPGAVPTDVPLSVVEAAGMTFATLPGEFTTVLGQRIRRDLQRRTGTPAMLVGLGGEYLGYFTTPEAYDAQHYEGASMMYGRDAGSLVRFEIAARLASPGRPERAEGRYDHPPGRIRRFGFAADRVARWRLRGAVDRVRAQLAAPAALGTVVFSVPAPTWPPRADAPRALPDVTLLDGDGRTLDAPHDATACVVAEATGPSWRYACFLVDPAFAGARIRLAPPGGPPQCSAPIHRGAHPTAHPCN